MEISGLLAPGFWRMEQSTSTGAGAGKSTYLPVVESSQVVEGRSYLQRKKKKKHQLAILLHTGREPKYLTV